LGISLDSLVGLPTSKYPHDILKDSGVMALAEKVGRMPPELREEIKDFCRLSVGQQNPGKEKEDVRRDAQPCIPTGRHVRCTTDH